MVVVVNAVRYIPAAPEYFLPAQSHFTRLESGVFAMKPRLDADAHRFRVTHVQEYLDKLVTLFRADLAPIASAELRHGRACSSTVLTCPNRPSSFLMRARIFSTSGILTLRRDIG
jgi:hypothetical protein